MRTRNVVVTDRQAKLIDKLVSTGKYQNASEVLRDGLRLVEKEAEEHEAKLKALRSAIRVGIDDMEAGRYTTFSDRQELRRHLRAIGAKAAKSAKTAAE